MRRPPRLPEGSKEKLALALKSARTKGQYQLVLCLWLREALRMNSRQVALALGLTPSGVCSIWSRFLRGGEAMFKRPGKGGRHHQHLSREAERQLLNRLLFQTQPGQAVIDSRVIQEAYERLVGRPVAMSVVHRMLRRHEWRVVDRSQIRITQGWAPGVRFRNDEVPPYEDPPTDDGSEAATSGEVTG